jgi:hypothetical protein
MPFQPFGAWAPDLLDVVVDAQQEKNVAGEASGVLPGANSYRPWPGLAAASIAVGSSTVTITIATPAVVTWTAHGLFADDTIVFSTTGALPTGLTAGTTYFVLAAGLAANTFRVSLTSAGAAINTSGSQSGTHTATVANQIVRGAGVPRTSSNAVGVFAGTANKLWKFATPSTAWGDVTRTTGNYALGSDDLWQFVQFGTSLIAVNGADAIQYIDVNSGTNFAPLSGAAVSGSPPTWARYAANCGDLLMFANTSNSPREVLWPARNDLTWWTKGYHDCDAQQFPDGGDIQGITGIEQGGLIIQTETVRQYFALQNRAIFQFKRAEQAQGTRSPYSIIPYQGGAFYYGTRGFVACGLDGTSIPIGDGYINEWFRDNSTVKTRPKALIGALDPVKARMFWLFPSPGNTSGVYDHVLCFDPSTVGTEYGPWTHAAIDASFIFAAATTATTLGGIAALYSTLSAVPYPLGSDVWKGGAPALGAFGSLNKMNFFAGSNLAATVDTAIFSPVEGMRTFIRGFRPVVTGADSGDITGRVLTAERSEDDMTPSASSGLNEQGLIEARASGRFVRAEVSLPAGSVWKHLSGIEDADIEADGER